MPSPSYTRIYTVLGISLAAISVAAIFIRLADAPGVVVAAYRMVIASLALLPSEHSRAAPRSFYAANPAVLGLGRTVFGGTLCYLDYLFVLHEPWRRA